MAKKARAHGFRVLFIYATDLLKFCIENDMSSDEEQTFEERIYTTDLLVISGLGLESRSPKLYELLAGILQTRQNDLAKTIVVSGLPTLALLRENYKGALVGFLDYGLSIACGCATACTEGRSHECH
jgi:DNA replication protein DnaC